MVEYTIINWLLIVGLILASSVQMVPTASGKRNIIEVMLLSYQHYFDSYFYVLSLPFP